MELEKIQRERLYILKKNSEGIEYKEYIPAEIARIEGNSYIMPNSFHTPIVKGDELGIIIGEVEVKDQNDIFCTEPLASILGTA